jgi:dTMP kinase
MKKKGILITIEGIHGAGKTTVCKMLVEKLKKMGIEAMLSIDQAGTEIGKKIREINLEKNYSIDLLTEALLIAAARRQNIAEVIKPYLLEGKVIISERYTDAYFAFQGYARGLPQEFLESVNSVITKGISPDLTILLDLDPKVALTRLKGSQMHRIEKEPLEFHEKVRFGYLEQAKKFPNRIKIINANKDKTYVFKDVWSIVEEYLMLKGVIKC